MNVDECTSHHMPSFTVMAWYAVKWNQLSSVGLADLHPNCRL